MHADQRPDLVGDEGCEQRRCQHGRPARRPWLSDERCGEHPLLVLDQVDRYGDSLGVQPQRHVVPAVDGEERRDVELLAQREASVGVRSRQLRVPFAVRVVDLQYYAAQLAAGRDAPEDAQRVEDVPEGAAGVGKHHHSVVCRRCTPCASGKAATLARSEGPDPRWSAAENAASPATVVDVYEPLVGAIAEAVAQWHPPRVTDVADDDCRQLGEGHHDPPSLAAASTPERQPSSWKPQPRCAPANASRGPPAVRSTGAAATDSGVKTGCA